MAEKAILDLQQSPSIGYESAAHWAATSLSNNGGGELGKPTDALIDTTNKKNGPGGNLNRSTPNQSTN